MADEGAESAETSEGGENDDKMDVWSDTEGQMQERGVEEAFQKTLKMWLMWLEKVD